MHKAILAFEVSRFQAADVGLGPPGRLSTRGGRAQSPVITTYRGGWRWGAALLHYLDGQNGPRTLKTSLSRTLFSACRGGRVSGAASVAMAPLSAAPGARSGSIIILERL